MTITSTNYINNKLKEVSVNVSPRHITILNEYFVFLKNYGINDFENITIIINGNIHYFFIPFNKNGYKFICICLIYDINYEYGFISIVKSCDISEYNSSLFSHFEKIVEFQNFTDLVFDKFDTLIKENTRRFYEILLLVTVFLIIIVFLVLI